MIISEFYVNYIDTSEFRRAVYTTINSLIHYPNKKEATWVSLFLQKIQSFYIVYAIPMFTLLFVFVSISVFWLQTFSAFLAVQVLILPLSLLVKLDNECIALSNFPSLHH